MEIESRLLPCGLHVVGSPPSAAEAVATLVSIAEIDRPENDPPTRGIPGIFAAAAGRRVEELYINSNKVLPTSSHLALLLTCQLLARYPVCREACLTLRSYLKQQ